MTPPVLYIFAGSNGAGKTTFARSFLTLLPAPPRFLNADEMAKGLSPFDPASMARKAGELLLGEIDECIAARRPFGLESTLSGISQRRVIERARSIGYQVEIHYLWIPSPELAIRRIAQRVLKGGHFVPDSDVIRRYQRSLDNFADLYAPLVDAWAVWDNTLQPLALLLEGPGPGLEQLKAALDPTSSPHSRPWPAEAMPGSILTPGRRGIIAAQAMAKALEEEQKRWGLKLLIWEDGSVVEANP